MSQAIYPALKGLSYGTVKTPSHKTLLQEAVSGREYRTFLRQYPRQKIVLKYEYLKDNNGFTLAMEPSDVDKLMGFFNQMRGSYDSFLLLDTEGDRSVTARGVPNNVFAVGDGVTAAFQLTRNRGGAVDPVTDFWATPVIYQADWRINPVNLLLWSEDFTQTWAGVNSGATNPTVLANQAQAPDNTISGGKITFPTVPTGVTNHSSLKQTSGNVNLIGSRQFTFSVYLKADSAIAAAAGLQLVIEDGAGAQTTTQTIAVTTSWQRYSITKTFSASAATAVSVYLRLAGSAGGPIATQAIYGWGAQLDEAVTPSSYTKTRAVAWAPNPLSTVAHSNKLLQSEAFNATWAATGTMTITLAAGTAPDTNNTANSLNDTDAANASFVSQAVTIVNDASTWTASVYVKLSAALVTGIKVALTGGTGLTYGICFDPSNGNFTGMAGTTAPASVTVQKMVNGWYRVSFPFANNNTGNVTATTSLYPAWTNVSLASTNLGTLTASAVAATGVTFLWGAQLENVAAASAYIKTAGVAINGLVDLTLTSTGIAQLAAAPASGIMLWADVSYYWRVRFQDDEMDFSLFLEKLYDGEVKLITVKP